MACRAGRVDDDGYCENCGHAQPRERDHMEQESGPVAAVSDRGLRHHRNEDAFAVGHTALPDGTPAAVAVVCDGVSSATRPDDASLAASRAASESLLAALPRGTHPQQAMHEAIVAASHAVNALAQEPATAREQAPHQNAPACTLVGAVVTGGLLVVGWVGDSRVYWVPADRTAPAARLTEDDSWAAQMVAAGLMNEAEAYADERAHAITGWLGADAYELEPHTASFKPDRAGVVVVCTDGLWNYAEAAEEMAEVVPPDAAERPLHSARVLVGHALDGGGHDNVTVAVVPFPARRRGRYRPEAVGRGGGSRPGRPASRAAGGGPQSAVAPPPWGDARSRGTRSGMANFSKSNVPQFSVDVYQNEYLPEGAGEVNAIVTVTATGGARSAARSPHRTCTRPARGRPRPWRSWSTARARWTTRRARCATPGTRRPPPSTPCATACISRWSAARTWPRRSTRAAAGSRSPTRPPGSRPSRRCASSPRAAGRPSARGCGWPTGCSAPRTSPSGTASCSPTAATSTSRPRS